MIRSLYISYDGATDPIGQSQVIPYLKGLARKGIGITLLTFDKKEYLSNYGHLSSIKNEFKEAGIKWACLRYHKKPPVISTFIDVLNGIFTGIPIVYKNRINCIHARSYVAALIGLILKRLFKLRFIFDMRGFWADERVEGRVWRKKGLIYNIAKFLEKRFLLDSDEVIVLTQKAKAIIDSFDYSVKADINVIPCMVDTESFKFSIDERQRVRNKYGLSSKFVFLYSGSLEYWYMKDKMLDFFLIAREFIANSHLLILSNMDKKYIENLFVSKGIGKDSFLILERIPYREMPKFISASDTGFFFITPVFSKKASSPTKFAEFMSCGLPVITNSGIGDLDEIITSYKVGTIVREFSKEEYTNRLRDHMKLIENGAIKENCIKLANGIFALKSGVERYSEIYNRLNRNESE